MSIWNVLGLDPVATGGTVPGVCIGAARSEGEGPRLDDDSPIDGSQLACFGTASPGEIEAAIAAAREAFAGWRTVPAPRRGELVRVIGEVVRERKTELAALVSLEVGKITQEALGEVQEWIDMCDFAVGLSRQLYGLTIASERPGHRMMEQWHPLGPIGVITAFNFPVAVWAWNAMLGLVCGDTIVWKPSEKAPLCALACHDVVLEAARRVGDVPDSVSSVILGMAGAGRQLADSDALPLISATGSVPMGRSVAAAVGGRLGRTLLELGGNNAMIVAPSADLDQALRAVVFAAVGTCGQRCTSLRRLILHESIADQLLTRLVEVYAGLPIGDPTAEGVLVGPLIDQAAVDDMLSAVDAARDQGGTVLVGGTNAHGEHLADAGHYVQPTLIRIGAEAPIVRQETFAPILYAMTYSDFDTAVAIQNDVPQGLSSAIFTSDVLEAERFLAAAGSDCGIANVNIGTSGAEIGGAFGGEKETGGGRESGSDAWKAYMRRATNTVNYSGELPLAQGIEFDVQS